MISDAVDILKNVDAYECCQVPPHKPKADEVYLFYNKAEENTG